MNPVFIPAKGQYKQGQTTKLKVMVTEENAQSIQMELKMRHITGTNMEDMDLRLYYTQHAY